MTPFRLCASSLVVRIIALGFCLVLIGTVGRTLVLARHLEPSLLEQSGAQLLALSESVAAQIGGSTALRRDALQRMAAQLSGHLDHATNAQGEVGPLGTVGQTPVSLAARLADFQAVSPLFPEGLMLLDVAGQVLAASAPEVATRHAALLGQAQAQAALPAGFAVGHPTSVGAEARAVLPLRVAVKGGDGRAAAVLVGLVALDATGFFGVLRDTRIGQAGGLMLVLPPEGVLRVSPSGVMSLLPMPLAVPQHPNGSAMGGLGGFSGVAVDVNPAGVEEVVATASVPHSPWRVVAHQPTSEVLMPLHTLQRKMLGNAGLIVIFMVVVLVVGLRYLFKPLVTAAEQADKMTRDGEPLAHLPVVRNDEVGHLTAAFNRLLDKLSDTQAALRDMAHHDPLTGLPNRMLLADVLRRALARAQRDGTEVAVLFLDLDGFKPINDAHGHATGDEALKQVAHRLTSAIRQADTVARIGGDEFVILLSDLHAGDRSGVAQVAAKCLSALAPPFQAMGHTCQLGASVGIAVGHGALPPDALMSAADTAMYSAKQAGKGQVVWGAPPG